MVANAEEDAKELVAKATPHAQGMMDMEACEKYFIACKGQLNQAFAGTGPGTAPGPARLCC